MSIAEFFGAASRQLINSPFGARFLEPTRTFSLASPSPASNNRRPAGRLDPPPLHFVLESSNRDGRGGPKMFPSEGDRRPCRQACSLPGR